MPQTDFSRLKYASRIVLSLTVLAFLIPASHAQDQPPQKPATGQKPGDDQKPASEQKPAGTKKDDAKKKPGTDKGPEQPAAPRPPEPKPAPPKPAPKNPPAPKPVGKPAPANPIQKLFQRILGPQKAAPAPVNPKAPQPVPPKKAATPQTTGTESDPIDRRLVIERSVEVAWKRATRAVEDGEWSRAVPLVDQILQHPADSVIRDRNGVFQSLRLQAQDLLRQAPENVRADFARQYGVVAQQDLDRAIETNDERLLVDVASRFMLTEAGSKAADLLATRLLDRGEFTQAAVWIEQAIRNESPLSDSINWQKKASLVFRLAGRTELVKLLKKVDGNDNSQFVEDLTPQTAKSIAEWMMLFGRADRHAVASGSRPVLMKRWSLPVAWNGQLVDKIDEIIRRAADNRKATIPAGMPLLVNGKVVFRTLRGVQVADALTGDALWSTGGDASLEAQLLGQPVATRFSPFQGRVVFNSTSYRSSASSLEQLLFQNSAYGLLSTDGRYVYVVEDRPLFPLIQTSFSPFNRNSTISKNSVLIGNRMRAYDLETGRLRWQAGGANTIEDFAPALRGSFFLGAPVPVGDELYVLGEREGEVSLHVLDHESGHVRWSQPLATVENPIERDLLRRIRSSQLAVSGATVVCPTTSGWLVGVDRTRRVILWTSRYQPRVKNRRTPRRFGRSMPRNEALGTRWVTSAPIIIGDRIVFTPPDTFTSQMQGSFGSVAGDNSGTIVCVHLRTGKKLWQRPRSNYVYLAGVHDDRVILVGPQSTKALSLVDGKDVWTQTLGTGADAAFGQASGRGVILDGMLYQPLQRNRLLTIDLKDGRVVTRLEIPRDAKPLGNLLTYRGQLISQHASEVTAWELSSHLQEQLAEIRKKTDRDEASTLFEARAAMAERQFEEVQKLLEPIRSLEGGTRSRERQQEIETLLRKAMIARVIAGDPEALSLLDELDGLTRDRTDRPVNLQLRYRSLRKTGKAREAFDVLLSMLNLPASSKLRRVGDDRIEVSLEAWLRGQLEETWQSLTEPERKSVGSQLEEHLKAADGNESQRRRLIRLFRFHQLTEPLRIEFAAASIEAGRLSEADGWLRAAGWKSMTSEAVELMMQLVARSMQAGDATTARLLVTQLQKSHSDLVTKSGKPVTELIKPKTAVLGQIPPVAMPDWGDFDLKLTRSPMNYMNRQTNVFSKRDHHPNILDRYEIEWGGQVSGTSAGRLSLLNKDGSVYWSVPLRNRSRAPQLRKLIPVGSQAIVYDRGVVTCLSIPDRRVRWSLSIMDPASVSSSVNRMRSPMVQGSAWVSQLRRRLGVGEPVPVANSSYVCVRERRRLTVVDTQTGNTRFVMRDIQQGTRVYGTRSTLFVIPPEATQAQALRSMDGRLVKRENFVRFYDSGLRSAEDTVVTSRVSVDDGQQKVLVESINPDTGESAWLHKFPTKAWFRGTSLDELAVLTKDGLMLLDIITGRLSRCEALPEINANVMERHVTGDRNNVYLILNTRNNSVMYYSNQPTMRVNGHVVAYNRRSGKLIWHKPVVNQQMMLTGMYRMPVLLFTNRGRRKGISTEQVELLALDKRAGRKVLEYSGVGSANLQSIRFDPKKRSITLKSYRDRMHLTAVNAQPKKADDAAGE